MDSGVHRTLGKSRKYHRILGKNSTQTRFSAKDLLQDLTTLELMFPDQLFSQSCTYDIWKSHQKQTPLASSPKNSLSEFCQGCCIWEPVLAVEVKLLPTREQRCVCRAKRVRISERKHEGGSVKTFNTLQLRRKFSSGLQILLS